MTPGESVFLQTLFFAAVFIGFVGLYATRDYWFQ